MAFSSVGAVNNVGVSSRKMQLFSTKRCYQLTKFIAFSACFKAKESVHQKQPPPFLLLLISMDISPSSCCCLLLILIHGLMLQTCEANPTLPLMTQLSAQNKVVIIGRRNGKPTPTRPPPPKLNGSKGMFVTPGPPPRPLLLPTP